MRITYSISESDYLATYEQYWTSKSQRTRPSILLGIAGTLLSAVILARTGNWIALVFLILSALLVSLPIIRRWSYRRAFQENAKYQGPIICNFREEGIATESAAGTSNLNWSVFQWALESDRFFLLLLSTRSLSIIPKCCFPDPNSKEEFGSLVEAQLGKIKRI